MAVNIVELATAGQDDCAFDQPCKFGHRVEGYAVYCHNDAWPDGPRKCCRTWHSGGEVKDEDCPGFQPNPQFKGTLNPTAIAEPRCSQCLGAKVISADRNTIETCPRCMGDGSEPRAVKLSVFGQDTLELCYVHSGRHPAQFDNNARIAETKANSDELWRMAEMGLISIRSISGTKAGATVVLYRLTAKGDAVMRANWAANKN